MSSDWDDPEWTATVSMRVDQLFFNCSSSSMSLPYPNKAPITVPPVGLLTV
ncbi:hypothetical protein NQZ68_016377 [Dissostichus eleginoides]|nr:hypothetical protein NQZ68_016377 [Dissostichus eleginoides]